MKKLITLTILAMTVCSTASAEEIYLPFPSGGKGTTETPYKLNTIADWRYLAQCMENGASFEATSFCMENDVDFGEAAAIDESGSNFLPLGMGSSSGASTAFKGSLDAKGHTIKNLRIIRSYLGSNGVWNNVYDCGSLFHHLEGGVVKNLTIGEGSEFVGPTYSGSIAGYCIGSQIINCTSYAYVHGGGYGNDSGVGGIVGKVMGTAYSTTTVISNCLFAGTVKGVYHAGGIVGCIIMSTPLTITECVNEGTVSSEGSRVGGILGRNIATDVTISYCTNRGTVESYTNPNSYAAHDGVGGIVGVMDKGLVEHCTNEGMVSKPGYSGTMLEGGIVGSATNATISYCSNTAPLIHVGCGIAGNAYAIKNCTNTGNVIKSEQTTAAITQGYSDNMENNYYTQNVVTNYYDEYSSTYQEVSGAICRGTYNWGLKDIATNNAAIMREITLTGGAAAGSYWSTFFRGCGNYKVDDNSTVYTASIEQGQTGSNVIRKLVLTQVPDGIIKAEQAVIIRSTQPAITLTLTSETPAEYTAPDNTLRGHDKPMPQTGTCYVLTTDGTGIQFALSTATVKPVNAAYIEAWSDKPETIAYRLVIDGEDILGIGTPPTGITIADNYATVLELGQTMQLTATISPSDAANQHVLWTSSNTDVLTVDENGLVTAVDVGQAAITATTEDQTLAEQYTLSATTRTIQVKVYPESITINEGDITLRVNESKQLTVTILPEKADQSVTWSGGRHRYVTVDSNGLVTVSKFTSGTVTITAKTSNGLSASINVTVDDSTGITNVNADGSRNVDFYATDGRPASGQRPGLYIQKDGQSVRKVIVR